VGYMAVEIAPKLSNRESRFGNSQAERNRTLRARFRKALARSENAFLLDVEFVAEPGITILFGVSGAGKTTLLECVAGLIVPDTGHIVIGDRELFDSQAGVNLAISRRQVGFVFQDLALFPHLSVERNVQYGLSHLGIHERRERTAKILESFHIAALGKRRPSEISGGERQRVALARTLVTDPYLLLLDEPLSGLDAQTKSKILDDLRAWNETHQVPILYVTHTREEVFALGERVIVLDAGRILAQGTPHEIIRAPRHETIAQLGGFENIFEATVIAAHLDRGTMTCELVPSSVQLETPLVRAEVGTRLKVGISAGNILLATVQPVGLSARNVLPGTVKALNQRDVIVEADVDCGVELKVHLTLAARDSLALAPGSRVWLIIKTHSCHLMTT
jgi:molybdate transport system ATP-binding protein